MIRVFDCFLARLLVLALLLRARLCLLDDPRLFVRGRVDLGMFIFLETKFWSMLMSSVIEIVDFENVIRHLVAADSLAKTLDIWARPLARRELGDPKVTRVDDFVSALVVSSHGATKLKKKREKEKKMQQQISPDPAILDALHDKYRWIPSAVQTRPCSLVRAAKEHMLSHSNAAARIYEEIKEKLTRDCGAFLEPNAYPYCVEGRHFVLWMWKSHEVHVTDLIKNRMKTHGFDQFVWYENPKKSIVFPDMHHVHVFCPPL